VNEQTGDRVGRMTRDATVTDELPIVTPADECSPTGITTGPDGNVWFTCELADQIGRITVPRPAPPVPPSAPAAVTAERRFTG
jgi:streptogramin lyase